MEHLIFNQRGARLLAHAGPPRQLATGFFFTEGPVWDSATNTLFFTDFAACAIHAVRPGGRPRLFRGNSGRAVGLSMTREGVLVAAETASHAVCLARRECSEVIAGRYDGKPFNSPNDVVVRRDGSVYFTDPYSVAMNGPREQGFNGFFRVPFRGGAYGEPVLLGSMERPNGLAFSKDERLLYVDDTNRNLIEAYTVRRDEAVSRVGVFARLDPAYGAGAADGLKVDEEDNVYVTGPGGIWVFDPTGTQLGLLRFPEPVGNFCFGGEDRATLFAAATTSVYSLRVGTPGIVPYREGV